MTNITSDLRRRIKARRVARRNKVILSVSMGLVMGTAGLFATGALPVSHTHAAPASTAGPTMLPQVALPYCDGEDDASNCYWDAKRMGDTRGKDFIVYNGEVWYRDNTPSCDGTVIPNPCDPDSNN